MVAIGVLISCVILFIISVFISELFFCFIELNIVTEKEIIIINVNNMDKIMRKEIDDLMYDILLGKPTTREK